MRCFHGGAVNSFVAIFENNDQQIGTYWIRYGKRPYDFWSHNQVWGIETSTGGKDRLWILKNHKKVHSQMVSCTHFGARVLGVTISFRNRMVCVENTSQIETSVSISMV